MSQGSVHESLGHPREIFKPVIIHSAYSFIPVHNHPSGVLLLLRRICASPAGFSKPAESSSSNWSIT
ncbi:MAG: hypothetical protein JO170_33330 [Verrucomicrobia bacterium]|nr:hypothetical protein [Verrucomicrobiota bacterium]